MTTAQLSLQLPFQSDDKPRYLREFPDFGLMDHPIPPDMIDASSSSNACPSFEMPGEDPDEAPVMTLFVDYKNPAKRVALLGSPKQPDTRFSVHLGAAMDVPALVTDSWSEVKDFIDLRRPFAGFEHDGMWITNPTCCDGGARFVVSPEVYGFKITHTGGGCMAWVRHLPEGGHLILTDIQGTSHELGEARSTFLIGVCTDEGEEISIHHAVVGSISNAGANFDGTSAIPPDPKFTSQAVSVGDVEDALSGAVVENDGELHAEFVEAAPVEEGGDEAVLEAPLPIVHRQVHRVMPAIPARIHDHVAHDKAVSDLEAMGLHHPSASEITSQAIANVSGEGLMVIETLRKQLAQTLNFLEHKFANEGKAVTADEWAENVRAFRAGPVSHVGIGESHVDRASVDLTKSRAALATAKAFLAKHQNR